jgi:hypothetical protein
MNGYGEVLEGELSWREAELASLKLLVLEAQPGSVRRQSLLRALWTLLYAHYEGFCKFSWDFYLENLERFGLKRGDCSAAIARFSLTKRFRELRGNSSDESLWGACAGDFDEWMKQALEFELHLETNSNLWPNLLRDNSTKIDLPSDVVDANELKLKTLVARRNDIAHGKKMVVSSLDEYKIYENAAVLVMHELAVAVLDCLEKKTYLK